MGDEIEFVELIDADPGAFGPAPRAEAPAPPREPVRKGPLVAAAAAVLVVGGLIAALAAWRPWEDDPSLSLADPRPSGSELSDRLVFHPAPSILRAASLGDAPLAEPSFWSSASAGYLFAEPGATFDPDDGDDRWFAFYALPAADPDAPLVFGQRRIAGAPAEVSDESDGALVQMSWGPVDGWVFTAAASNVAVEAAVEVAEHLRIVDEHPEVLDRAALDGLRPLGPFGDYVTLATITGFAQYTGTVVAELNAVYYGFDGEAVVSMPGNPSALDLVEFAIDADPQQGTVHGLRALGFTKGAGPFGDIDRSTVLWWEGGRVVLVSGDGDLDATFVLADTVRPATADEWAEVRALDAG